MGVALNWFGFFLFIMVWLDCLHRIPCVRVVLVLVTKDGWRFVGSSILALGRGHCRH